ncbi:hypothetical protein CBM2588_B90053 [Cupriavidus taiwanensis]|nr:hypothetical protein CBM2588_B90053 [Cupriavidus taiwanensis]
MQHSALAPTQSLVVITPPLVCLKKAPALPRRIDAHQTRIRAGIYAGRNASHPGFRISFPGDSSCTSASCSPSTAAVLRTWP